MSQTWQYARLLALVLLLLGGGLSAQESRQGPGIDVEYPLGMAGAAERVLQVYPRLKRDCEIKLGFRYNNKVRVWICRDHESFNDQIQALGGRRKPKFVAAVAFPLVDVIILKSLAWTRGSAEQFEITLEHEISHCVLGQLRRNHSPMDIPRWFDEGVAQWVSEGLYVGDNLRLHRALRQEAWIPFEELENNFPDQEGASDLAYAQSESMVRFIAELNDPDRDRGNIHAILLGLVQGQSFDHALFTTTGLHLEGLETRWSQQKKSDLPFPVQLLPDVIFAVAVALLSLLAFVSYRVRRSRRLAQLDREELGANLTENQPDEPTAD